MNLPLPESVASKIARAAGGDGRIVCLTGAGISAESGIPTFRGQDGFWTKGSVHYRPEDVATWAFFSTAPREQWPWYLWRRSACAQAQPNRAHDALAEFERQRPQRFQLITQNVDGLHRRAGSDPETIYEIHGNLNYMRCAAWCHEALLAVPEALADWRSERTLDESSTKLLTCERCGGWMRPHILWFDECYDEEHYRYESSMTAAATADLLIVIGTMGATTLPQKIAAIAVRYGAAIIDLNVEDNIFGEMALASGRGAIWRRKATESVPAIVEALIAAT